MLVKALYAISKTTGFLAKTLDKGAKKTDDILQKEYLHNIAQFIKDKSGDLAEKAGYAAGKVEEFIEDNVEKRSKA